MSATETSIEDLPSDTVTATTTTTEEYNSDLYDFGEEEQEVEEEEKFYLNGEDFISGPFFSEQSTIQRDILELHCSYGYDCKRLFNICAPDKDTIVFASGNLIHFFDIPSDIIWTRRSYLGGGIGHIIVNPNPVYQHLAVAENGENPPIIIYRWPEMDIAGILKEGAAKRFAHINYSPDGELLVSQSYGPDFLITVWRWKRWRTSPIILRIKSHVNDVFKCMFSPYVPGQISTGGSGHIKFWKMAQTFTGLKLQGELGRFGKTEISDIVGIHPMPDEKVISGSEWGNLLVWEAGLIKIEVYRTMRRKCHGGPVMQLEYIRSKGEIWSISLDGWLRAWEYRLIDEADPPDDDRVVQMLPSYERHTPTVQYMSICKKKTYDSECTHYYAQDGNGGLWLVDLILRAEYESAKCLRRFHAGPVADMQPCPWGPFLASLGDAGSLHIYDYEQMILVFRHVFNAKGRSLIWVPVKVEPSGCFLIAGFDDGVVRIVALHFPSDPKKIIFTKPDSEDEKITFTLIQSIKPHNRPVTKITLSPNGKILVSGGEDKTIFIFMVKRDSGGISLKPIGFCPLDAIPTCFTWHPTLLNTLLIGCMHGEMFQFTLPQESVNYTKISYLLHTIKPIKNRFLTCKSLIRRRLHIQEIERRKAEKIERKRREMAKLKAENPGLDIDEELFLQDSESEEILEPLYIPPVPNRIIFMEFTPEDTIWVSVSGFDAGYIYEMKMEVVADEPVNATMVEDADDVEIHGILYSPDNEYLITSMETGQIRVNRVNPENFRDLSDYWLLSMHDNFNGKINKMCFSYDKEFFFSCGEDGNLFSYNYNSMQEIEIKLPVLERMPKVVECQFDENYESLSLEEVMIKAEYDKQMRLANEHKRKLRNRLNELRNKLTTLLERNCNLPKSQRYTLREFIIDERIMKALDDLLGAKVALEKRKLAYDVEKSTVALKKLQKYYTECLDVYPIDVKAFHKYQISVGTISQRSLGNKFYDTYGLVEKKIEEEFLRGRMPARRYIEGETIEEKKKKPKELEPFLVGLSPSTIEFRLGIKLTRLLKRYRERRAKKELRQEEWNEMLARKPDPSKNHPEDEENLSRAEAAVGDFKLKTAPDYKVPEILRESMVKKYLQLLDARLKAYKEMLYVFNRRVYKLRDEKVRLIGVLKDIEKRIFEIHEELPEHRRIQPTAIPEMTPEDFPEKEIQLKMNTEPSFQASLRKKKVTDGNTNKNEKKDLDLFKLAYRIDQLPDLQGSAREIVNQVSDKSINPFKKVLPADAIIGEIEIKAKRLISNLFEQDELLKQMQTIIDDFDQEIVESVKQRFDTRTTCTFMDLHILVLNQELVIVKDFETYENHLSATAIEKYNLMMDIKDNMKRTELKIEKHFHNIDKCNDEIKELQQTFLTAAKDNKFWDFLRRIFKKKWRPPKIVNPDDSESSSMSSSSSSSSEEDDAGSLDSRDIGPIRLDESVCPKGCDKEIYEYTFLLRGKRHEQERQIIDEKKAIENFKKDMEQAAKKMKIAELASKQSTSTLEEYRCKKQRALNEVTCTIVLKLSQLRHIRRNGNEISYAKLSDTLVFGQNMLSCLFTRVNELLKETLEERGRYRRNRLHLHRMNVDINHMNNQISKLKDEIVDLMLIKFGRKVNIDELEESILKRLVQDLRFALLKFGEEYERELENCRRIYGEKQIELKAIIRENTARLELLGILNKEKTKLSRILDHQHALKEKAQLKEDLYYLDDIDKLVEVSKAQKDEIQKLKEEIKALNTKALPLEVLHPKDIEKAKSPEKDEIIVEYDESLDELFIAPEYKPMDIPDISKENLDTKITEEELIVCIQELMTEIAEANIKSQNFQEIIPKILCDVIEQVPLKYLHKTESIEHIANIISDVITDVSSINKNQIIEILSKRTTMKKKEIADILEAFIRKTEEKLEEIKRSEQTEVSKTEKSTDRTESSGKSSECCNQSTCEYTQPSTAEKPKRKKPSLDRSSLTEKSSNEKKTSKQSIKRSSITEKSIQKKPSSEKSDKSIEKKSSTDRASITEKKPSLEHSDTVEKSGDPN